MTTILTSKQLDDYTEKHCSPESAALAALNRETNLKRGDAVMISGHVQGSFLQMLSVMIRPKTILEIGTFTGYSAICFAGGLPAGGHLYTIEIDEELECLSSKYFKASGMEDKITRYTGKAKEIIPTLTGPFDLVFIDADKLNYEQYYDMIFDKVPIGGYILADNVLYNGEVVLPEDEQSKNARAMHSFNKKIKADPRVHHTLVPVRDGIMVIRKIKE